MLVLALAGAGCGSSSDGSGTGGAGSSLGSAGSVGTGGSTAGTGGDATAGHVGATAGDGGSSTPGDGGGGGTGTGGVGASSGTGGAASNGGGTGGAGATGPVGAHAPWVELASAVLDVQGGTALSAGGKGQNGGLIHLIAGGDVSLDPSQPAVPAQTVPATPAGAKAVDDAALAADVSVGGDASIASATAGGTDATRTISAGGDLYVTGTLRAADLGSARQALTLKATNTIYVSGTIDASGAAGSGQAGGAVNLSAKTVIITGKVLTAGGDGSASAGAAGPIVIQTSSGGTFITGTIDASGGNVNAGGTLIAGPGATFKIQSGGDVGISGTVLLRGGGAANSGAGPAQGGDAGSLVIDSNGAVTLGGVIDGRGGLAKATGAGGPVTAGKAGEVHIGETAPPKSIAIRVPVVATGGDADAAAGTGGNLKPEPGTGSFVVAGAHELDLSGGSSMTAPGAGGLLNGGPRSEGMGGVHVSGDITANGGSIMAGGSGDGADGGRIDMELIPTLGSVTIDQTANLVANGGASGGTGTAGGGGHVWFFTKDGDVTCAGHVITDGGDAPDPGGVGGKGGMIYFFTDNNFNATTTTDAAGTTAPGNLWITTTGVLQANGGAGATGGSARSDGVPGRVPPFPDEQESIAIFLNCDGAHGNTFNWMENDGWLYANGGAHNGNGGDIVYHGIPKNARQDPNFGSYGDYPVPSGNIQLNGDGTGKKGDFLGE
ncbi:MAG: hypothetical protein ABUS79_03415 [Pseudomonadota bacterium]